MTDIDVKGLIETEIAYTLTLVHAANPREKVLLAETVQKLYAALESARQLQSVSWTETLRAWMQENNKHD